MSEILIGLIVAAGGSLLNFISTKTYNEITGSSKNFMWGDSANKITKLKAPLEFEELKKRIRIVVIDDEESFPVPLFNTEGYNIEKWDKVKDYGKLESGAYDIIVLDIKGVAEHISADDGLGVLESLKKKNPAQIIIAYSQHSYDLSKSKFWELADEKIAKPSDFLKMKNIIDNLINTKFKPERYIQTLHLLLQNNNVNKKTIKKIDADIYKAITKKVPPIWQNIFSFASNRPELANQLTAISATILKFFR